MSNITRHCLKLQFKVQRVYLHNSERKRIEYFECFIKLKALQYISFQYIQSIIVIARVTTARVPLCINASRALKLRGGGISRTKYCIPFFTRREKERRRARKICRRRLRRNQSVDSWSRKVNVEKKRRGLKDDSVSRA